MFVAFSGEEQGLLGSAALADRAASEGWKIDALLSNDMIGNSENLSGRKDSTQIRIFSEDSLDHQSRELARYIEWLQRTEGVEGFRVKLVLRADRFGRGGDHTPFNRRGFTAVRLVEMHEEYSRQHTVQDQPDFVDFEYLSQVALLDALVLKNLANAAPAPTEVRVDRRQSHEASLTWRSAPGVSYTVYWRDTACPTWTHSVQVGETGEAQFPLTSKDDNFFAVGVHGGIPVLAE
jgi:Zn-dependent M28 family amino/carboxypeptidase